MNEYKGITELISLFLSECESNLQLSEIILLTSDQNGSLTDIGNLFRYIHTVKGSSAMMEYTVLADTAHQFEDILSVLRKRGGAINTESFREFIDIGLDFISFFRAGLDRIRVNAVLQPDESLSNRIRSFAASLTGAQAHGEKAEEVQRQNTVQAVAGESCVNVKLRSCPLPNVRASIIIKSVSKLCAWVATEPQNPEKDSSCAESIRNNGFTVHFVPNDGVTVESVIGKLTEQPYTDSCTIVENIAISQPEPVAVTSDNRFTVTQHSVNSLIAFIGEVISAEGALETYIESNKLVNRQMAALLSALRHAIADTNTVASDMGLQSIGNVFIGMQKTVRSMAKEIGKEIHVTTTGADVQVDKSVLDLLSDILIHIVRNAADHGIETPDERVKKGKSPVGNITLAAEKKSGYLYVTVTDDGAGLPYAALLDKYEKLGKLNKSKELYTEAEIAGLLLTSGVSTNQTVTQYSGRGVGMDAVTQRMKQVGGFVSVDSREGFGSSFCLKIPVTLMMIDGIQIVRDDGNELIIPVNAIAHIIDNTGLHRKYDGNTVEYDGEPYRRLILPGENISGQSDYMILFGKDYGSYYLPAKKVKMMSACFVKPMPDYIVTVMGKRYPYSGCVLDTDAKLRPVLDIAKAIKCTMFDETTERHT